MTNGMMGNTARDILLKKHLDEEVVRAKTAEQAIVDLSNKTFAANLEVSQEKSTGVVSISLINKNNEIIVTKQLDLDTEHIISKAELKHDEKGWYILFTRLNGDSFKCYINELVSDYEQKIHAEKTRAIEVESQLNAAINTEKQRAIGVESALNTAIDTEKTARINADTNLNNKIYEKYNEVKALVTSGNILSDYRDKLPGSQTYNLPYYFSAEYSNIDAVVKAYSISLDGAGNLRTDSIVVPAATYTTAGLETAADKKALDELNGSDDSKGAIRLLGKEQASGEPYHFTYYYDIKPAADKYSIIAKTITLDNNKTITDYPFEINGATTAIAGLETAAEYNYIHTTIPNNISSEAARAVAAENDLDAAIKTIYTPASADQENLSGTGLLPTEVNRLDERIDNVSSIGRFLSLWNCSTGKPYDDPTTTLPYVYHTGDYYRVGAIASGTATNYRPNGTQYSGEVSTTVESATVAVGDIYFFDGSVWQLQINTERIVNFSQIAGDADDNSNLHEKLDAIRTSITTEGSLREQADTTLTTNLNTEINDRQTSFNNLNNNKVSKINTTTYTGQRLYTTIDETAGVKYGVDPEAWQIPQFTADGKLKSQTPTEDTDVANKNYVDNKFGNFVDKTSDETISGIKTFDTKVRSNGIESKSFFALADNNYTTNYVAYLGKTGENESSAFFNINNGDLYINANSTQEGEHKKEIYLNGVGVSTLNYQPDGFYVTDNTKTTTYVHLGYDSTYSNAFLDAINANLYINSGSGKQLYLNGTPLSSFARINQIPTTYIKNASVSNNTLTLTKQDDSIITFQGGSDTCKNIEYKNISGTVLGNLKFVKCSQAEYDALATKDTDTFYIITTVA